MPSTHDPSEIFIASLLAGDAPRLLALFPAAPAIDDPLGGRVRSFAEFEPFFAARHRWLFERHPHLEALRLTSTAQRSVFESLLHLHLPDKEVALPVAVVSEHAPNGLVSAIRVYHSLWPLYGEHRVRPPLLQIDHSIRLSGAVAIYQRALAEGDIPAIVGTFEEDGYFREPAGGEWFYQGRERLREFMTHLLSNGGITLEHCTATDDGVACAIEFNAVHFGPHNLQPQAGVAVYERGASGLLHAARIYDDVNVEALAG